MQDQYPTVLDRTKSTLIDTVILVAAVVLFSDAFNSNGIFPDWVKILICVLLFFYEPICTTLGGTLGNHKIGIRVRKSSDEQKRINILQATVRYALKLSLGWLSFITIFFSKKSRTIHDFVAGTVMVNVAK